MQQLSLQQQKEIVRGEMRELTAASAPEVNKYRGWLMLQHLQALPIWKNARTVFCFISTPTEPSTEDLLQAVFDSGRTLCVPRTGPQKGHMDAVKVAALFALKPNKRGILEPPVTLPATPPEQLDLVIAPCLAMTPKGVRLGHGGGYYDRFLAKCSCPTVAFCPAAQLRQELPSASFDIPLDLVITENGVL